MTFFLTNTQIEDLRKGFLDLGNPTNGVASKHIGAGHAYNSSASAEYSDLDATATALEHSSTNTEITTGAYQRETPNTAYVESRTEGYGRKFTYTLDNDTLPASGSDDTKIIREFGIFSASSGGTLMAFENTNAIIKIADADIIYEVNIEVTRG